MHEIINWMNVFLKCFRNLLENLDGNTRTDIYIGITGILVAIVIFIAEIISNKKIEIYKRLMLEETQILKVVRNMIIILAIIWVGDIAKTEKCTIIYCFEQIFIDGVIVFSMFQTFNTFLKVIKLNTDKDFFDNQLKEYLYSKVEENISINEKNNIKIDEKNKEFFKFIKKSKVFKFESDAFKLVDKYDVLESNKYGYVTSYNYYILNKIEENLKSKAKQIKNIDNLIDNTNNQKPEIYICKKVGDKCGNNYPIAYYKNVKKEFINMINRATTIDNRTYINCDAEIAKIIDDIFFIAYDNSLDIDNEDILIDFYEYICKNRYESIITTFLDKVDSIYKKKMILVKMKLFVDF